MHHPGTVHPALGEFAGEEKGTERLGFALIFSLRSWTSVSASNNRGFKKGVGRGKGGRGKIKK